MKVRLQQLNPVIGDIGGNVNTILHALAKANKDGIDLLILPELAVCGYPAMDLLERASFRDAAYRANAKIIESTGETGIIFGTITRNPSPYGRKCYNSALVAQNGKELARVHKTLLPTYDVFDDFRYFEPNKTFECVQFGGAYLGITICEDIWYNENDIQYHTYEVNPARVLAEKGAEVIINISASPFTKNKPTSREQMIREHVEELDLPVFYANQVGGNTELVYDGDSMVIKPGSEVVARMPLFEVGHIDVDWDLESGKVSNIGSPPAAVPGKSEGMFKALAFGLRDYLAKTGVAESVVVGLSGGIDSALAACIAVEALGNDRVVAVGMPSEFSSEESMTDAANLAKNLEIELLELPIHSVYKEFRKVLEPEFKDEPFGVAEENIQTRIRGVLLMAISNKFGHMMLNTGNKSELATGYCTLYGDMAGGLGVISDLYKSEVYEMANWLNRKHYAEEIIPKNIIEKEPSAELRPGQKDTDTLPPYDILDAILELYIEKQESPGAIIDMGFEEETVLSVVGMVDRNEYKRYQAVPGLKVSTKAFGTGRRWPIVQNWTKNQLKFEN